MGYGLGAALGAKTARPDKTVINIAGDGCFRMNMNELATASRYNIPVIEVVINNHVLGMVRQWQTLFYGGRYSATVLNDKVDFVKVAEALGCKGIRVTKKEEVGPALEEAIAYGGPVLLDCQIDCDDKVFPMVPAGAAIEDAFDEDDLKKKEMYQRGEGACIKCLSLVVYIDKMSRGVYENEQSLQFFCRTGCAAGRSPARSGSRDDGL